MFAPLRAAGGVLAGVGLAVLAIGGCGPEQPANPIIGGTAAAWANFPYFAEINPGAYSSPPQCDGSVIAREWVLTAAHCFDDGVTGAQVGTVRGVMGGQATPNPLWNKDHPGHDLALVHVPAELTAGISPLPLGSPWDARPYTPGTLAIMMGTGVKDGTAPPNQFRVANSIIRSDDDMADILSGHWISALMIGAGSPDNTTCNGDSGGPLVAVPAVDRRVQVGVAAFGPTDCRSAAAFMELSGAQLAWIASVVPDVTAGWGGCVDAFGRPGKSTATYGDTAVSGPNRDGAFYWNIHCQATDAILLQARHSGLCAAFDPGQQRLRQDDCSLQQYHLFVVAPQQDGYNRIVLGPTDSCLGVADSSQDLRASIGQYPCASSSQSQEWTLRRTDRGYFQIVARHSGQCMDVEDDAVTPGPAIWQYTCDLGYNQQFQLVLPPQCPADVLTGPSPLGPLPTQCTDKRRPGP
jgi:Trypsin/Ricin-type beta-trefoil lectin domain-like